MVVDAVVRHWEALLVTEWEGRYISGDKRRDTDGGEDNLGPR